MLLPTAAELPKASESAPVPPSASDEAGPMPLPPERTPTPPVHDPPWPSETQKPPLSNDTRGGRRQGSQLLDAIPQGGLRGEIPSEMAGVLGGDAASKEGWLARLPAVSFISSSTPMPGAATGPPLPMDSAAAAAFPPSFTSPPAASEVRTGLRRPPWTHGRAAQPSVPPSSRLERGMANAARAASRCSCLVGRPVFASHLTPLTSR